MRTLTAAVLAIATTTLCAQDLPLPAALLAAKTTTVVNGGVDQDVYDRLIIELRAWKRLEVVTAPAPADVAITITGENTVGTNGATGQPVRAIAYRLVFKQGETVLYSDQLKGCCSMKAMVRKTLEKLDKRMTGQR